MEHKHTPGEWDSKQNGRFMPLDGWSADHEDFICCSAVPIKADGKVVAIVVDGRDDLDLEMAELKANAHLIAAAPDLLEALEAAVECGMVPKSSASDGGACKRSRQVEVADMIRAAIAKASGEANG